MDFSAASSDRFEIVLRASTLSGFATCVLFTPLDVARHSAQAAISRKGGCTGFVTAARTAAKPGIVNLWRGLPPALALSTLNPLVFLLAYEQQKSSKGAFESALYARAAQVVLLQPFEVMRVIRQSSSCLVEGQGAHLQRSFRDIVYTDRPRSLWRALLPTMARDVTTSMLFLGAYTGLQRALLGSDPGDSAGNVGIQLAALGSASGAVAAAVTQPLDVVKTRMQVHQLVQPHRSGYTNLVPARFFRTLRDVHKMVGLGGLWTGVTARVLKAALSGLLLGPLYEFGQVVAEDAQRPQRMQLYLPQDPSGTIVHPRSYKSMYIEIK